jgi:crotonobetainyl-CoA:carnitine CoA-transferase CaiB-like acyl-CoA transferase
MAGGDACYGFYPAKKGWIAVGALEPHFQKKLQEKLGLPDLRRETLRRVFATRTGEEWQEWALKENIPITKCGFK